MAENGDSGISNSGGGDTDRSLRVFFQANPPLIVTSICLIILSMGAVLGALLFIYLCFRYPDSANTLIPLISAPLGYLVIKHGKKVLDAVGSPKNTTPPSKAIESSDSPAKLETDK